MDTLVSGDPSALFWLARRRERDQIERVSALTAQVVADGLALGKAVRAHEQVAELQAAVQIPVSAVTAVHQSQTAQRTVRAGLRTSVLTYGRMPTARSTSEKYSTGKPASPEIPPHVALSTESRSKPGPFASTGGGVHSA